MKARSWTETDDQFIISARASGMTWKAIAKHLGVSTECSRERARRIGQTAKGRPIVVLKGSDAQGGRVPMPVGDPVSWGLITQGTILEGSSAFDSTS